MKYIRTKDGIYELVKEDGNWLEIISNFERKMQCHCEIKKHAVIKQADTIEELCDAFVSVDKDNNRICHLWNELDRLLVFERGHDTYFYGAIWTDKGLIYVAKMNDKGELKLL